MKKAIILAAAFVLLGGCTSYSGISKADKTGSYYITGNTTHMWVTPNVDLCTTVNGGNLECKRVQVRYK